MRASPLAPISLFNLPLIFHPHHKVSIADGETTLIHLESGETLEIMHTAAMDGMAGLPGAQESAAAMQVYSYFQPEEEKRTTVPSQSPLHRRAQTRKDGRARSTPIGELETSDDELPEDGVSGVDMPPASAEATPHPVRTFLVTKQVSGIAVACGGLRCDGFKAGEINLIRVEIDVNRSLPE